MRAVKALEGYRGLEATELRSEGRVLVEEVKVTL